MDKTLNQGKALALTYDSMVKYITDRSLSKENELIVHESSGC